MDLNKHKGFNALKYWYKAPFGVLVVECPFLYTVLQFIGIHIFLQLLKVSIQESDMSSENWLAFMWQCVFVGAKFIYHIDHLSSIAIECPGACADKKEY